jgi:hypothetical protein
MIRFSTGAPPTATPKLQPPPLAFRSLPPEDPADLSAVAHLDDGHRFRRIGSRRIVDLIENSIVALAVLVFLGAAELLAAAHADSFRNAGGQGDA